jgi:hypothetical protein
VVGDRLAVWLAFVVAATLTGRAGAQTREPVDVSGWAVPEAALAEMAPELPTPPDDYVSETRGGVEWTFPASATSAVRDLQAVHAETWTNITGAFRGPIDDRVVIRIGLDPEEMHALAPVGHPAPDYAVGVAYPRFGVILLSLQAPETWERPDLDKVFAHELSHIALYRAVSGKPLPRWLVEGVAIQQAEENDLDRIQALWRAVVAGNVVPLDTLDERFPSAPHRVNVAYAESADIVAHLWRSDMDRARFRSLLENVRDGEAFDDAFLHAYDMSLETMEHEWREQLDERFHTLPLVVTGSGLWVLASFLLVLAYFRRRRKHRETLARWAEQEAKERAAIERAEDAVLAELARRRESEGVETIFVIPGEPREGREPGVPTVEHEGRNHTLH